MPGVYTPGHFDIVGTIVGVVDRAKVLPRKDIRPGDLLVGLASSGPHTNGYSLLRTVFEGISLNRVYPELGIPLADAVLAPHRNYQPALQEALDARLVKGLAHITGGGFIDNLPRILPPGCGAQLLAGSWQVPPLFELIQSLGGIETAEMYRVFNMGIGMVAVIDPGDLPALKAAVPEQLRVIGQVSAGQGVEVI